MNLWGVMGFLFLDILVYEDGLENPKLASKLGLFTPSPKTGGSAHSMFPVIY